MLVLHTHWIAPGKPEATGGVLFWAEDPSCAAPAFHSRLPQRPRPRPHPFQAPINYLQDLLRKQSAARESLILNLPTTRTGPLPSPGLEHNWRIDREMKPILSPWIVNGIKLSPKDALPLLLDLPVLERKTNRFLLGEDAQYWRIAATMALEAMAAQKVIPVIASGRNGYIGRWMTVLDSPRDAQRIAFMERNMPPVCRAEMSMDRGQPLSAVEAPPRELFSSFINSLCDALARQWGWNEIRKVNGTWDDQPAYRWLASLFRDDPQIKGPAAQLQALESGFKAWIRNLHLAGDSTFRIAFRLEAPGAQSPDTPLPGSALSDTQPMVKDWRLHFLLQASDDPSLMVPADQVWKTTGGAVSQLGRRFDQPQEKLLAGLGFAGRLFGPIGESLRGKSPTHLDLDTRQAYTFLREAAPVLEEAGFGLLAPPWWNQPGARLGMRLRLKPNQKANKDMVVQGKLKFNSLVQFRWELSLGDTALTEQEFRALAALKTPLIQIRGQWVQLDPEQVEAAIQFWEKQKIEGEISLLEALQMSMNASELSTELPVDEVVTEDWLNEWLEKFQSAGQDE